MKPVVFETEEHTDPSLAMATLDLLELSSKTITG